MHEMSHLQYLSKTCTSSSKVTLLNIRKGFVKVTFPSPLQYLNGSLSKSLRSFKIYFRTVKSTWPTREPMRGDLTRPIFHLLMLGKLGVARVSGYQHISIGNAKSPIWRFRPMRDPNSSGFALQWNIGFKLFVPNPSTCLKLPSPLLVKVLS